MYNQLWVLLSMNVASLCVSLSILCAISLFSMLTFELMGSCVYRALLFTMQLLGKCMGEWQIYI